MLDLDVVTAAEVVEQDLRQLVINEGGEWPDGAGFGKIDRPTAYVEVDYYSASLECDEEEARSFEMRHGVPPASIIGIHYRGSLQLSRDLALSIAREAIVRWGGEVGE